MSQLKKIGRVSNDEIVIIEKKKKKKKKTYKKIKYKINNVEISIILNGILNQIHDLLQIVVVVVVISCFYLGVYVVIY